MTGWRAIHPCRHSKPPGSDGRHASPKGQRHASATRCRVRRHLVPLVHKWLGHAQLATTAVYPNAVGAEGQDYRPQDVGLSEPTRCFNLHEPQRAELDKLWDDRIQIARYAVAPADRF
jgi:hypothetical protein